MLISMWQNAILLLTMTVVTVTGKPPHIIFIVADDLGKWSISLCILLPFLSVYGGLSVAACLSVCLSVYSSCLSAFMRAYVYVG